MPRIEKFSGPGSTPLRREFWDSVVDAVLDSTKKQGQNVRVSEHERSGTLIESDRHEGLALGACCVGSECSITTAEECDSLGGQFQGVGTTCIPNPCGFECDGSMTVHIEYSVSGEGTCDTGIVISTISPSTSSGDYAFDSQTTPPIGDAVYCTKSQGDLSGGSILFDCNGTTEAFGIFNFGFLLLVRVITAGDIYGTEYEVGDWVVLVGSISYNVGVGTCDPCNDTVPDPNYSAHQVFPGSNLIEITEGGITTSISVEFSIL